MCAGQGGSQREPSSETLVEDMWQLAAPSLPTTDQEVAEWLFHPSAPRIPVTDSYYQQEKEKRPNAADRSLVAAGTALVATTFTACITKQPPAAPSSESHTAWLVQYFLQTAFEQLKLYSCDRLQYDIRLNESEKDCSHTSRSQKHKVRPDTMVVVSSCTVLLGEDKHTDFAAALRDLQNKRIDLLPRHYKDVTFLLGYAAARTRFRWYFLPQQASQVGFLIIGNTRHIFL